jgi:predicted O-methyltransferase YrrM
MPSVEWVEDDVFRLDGATFITTIIDRFRSSHDRFMVVKHRHMIQRYEALVRRLQPDRIVEIGICQGGSTAFLALLAAPDKMVAIDIKPDATAPLEELIRERSLHDRVHTYYSFDQADIPRLRHVVATEFSDEFLDLVIDDASHELAPTRASFNALFPQLREGGAYVIEDWSGQHHLDAALEIRAATNPVTRGHLEAALHSGDIRTPLSVLVFELVLAVAYAPAVFSELIIADGMVQVVRGPGAISQTPFDLSRVYSDRARDLLGRIE